MIYSQQALQSLIAMTRQDAFATAAALAIGTPAFAPLMKLADMEIHNANVSTALEMGLIQEPEQPTH